eukprot:TCONS_00062481-protein
MYTGYWVSNFTTMEEIAIDNLHYLGYKPNGDQLILDTEEKPSYEAKTGICEREKLQERKDKDDDFNIRKEDFTSNHNHHIQQQPPHVNQHQSFQTPSNMDHHSSNHPLNRENPQKPTGISLYDNQQQSPTYPYSSNGQPHSNLPQNQVRPIAYPPSLPQGQQPFGNLTHQQYYQPPSYQNPGLQATEPQNFHNSNLSNYGNTHPQSNPTGHDLYGDALDDLRETEADTASPHSSERPTHHQRGDNVNQQMHGYSAQQMDHNAHQQGGIPPNQQMQPARPVPKPRRNPPANLGNMQNNPDSNFSTNEITEEPTFVP